MLPCPKCQALNRPGAKFCKECSTQLPETAKSTIPLDERIIGSNTLTPQPVGGTETASPPPPSERPRLETQPLPASQQLTQRPAGAIFADQFLLKSLIFNDETQNRYLVTQLALPDDRRIKTCPRSDCGANFSPAVGGSEKFCTSCGDALVPLDQDLVLIETLTPIPDNLARAVSRGLSHAAVRSPLAIFSERLEGVARYGMVVPQVAALEGYPDKNKAISWGGDLARGLDYLHYNGISFGGQVNDGHLALTGDRAVWADFTNAKIHEDAVHENQADLRSLALLIFHWLTGKVEFEHDANLLPAQNQVFEVALDGKGFASGEEFALALEGAQTESVGPHAVDIQLGRRTHVGMVRSLNEDSMMTVEMNRNQQSVSQPVGVYVVADGMGGHAAGEIASGTIVNTIAQQALNSLMAAQFSQGSDQDLLDWIRGTVQAANTAVFDLRKSAGTDMGSTLVAAVVQGNNVAVAHVGDSRAYIISAQEIRQITTDHSLVERLIATNQITREEARFHPQRNVIYRTVGDKANLEVDVSKHTLAVDEYLLLCSDGLSGMVEDHTIHRIVSTSASPQIACDELVNAANAAGGDDNVTVILVHLMRA